MSQDPASLADPLKEANEPSSRLARFGPDTPLVMDCGVVLEHWQIAYQTYGALNADKSNAVLVCHALTGDQHVASRNPITGKGGWWTAMIGPGQADRHRPLLRDLRQCAGRLHRHDRARPRPIPATGKPWGLDFPIVTIRDMVRAQAALIDRLGIATLFCVAGGSMGGMQVLQWAASYPERVFSALPLATGAKHSAQNIAFHEVGRQAVMADPDWRARALSRRGHAAVQGPVRRAHGRAYHLSLGAGAAPQIRPQAAGPGGADLLLRRRFPGRELSAPSGHQLRRALRRQFLSLCHPRHGLFRPRRRP